MSIAGGIKFFEKSLSLFKDGTTGSATTNEDAVPFMLNTDKYTQWESISSNDLTTEVITVVLPKETEINRILVAQMNLKEFSIKYFDGASFVDFTNVVGVNGALTVGINETDFSYDSAYYEFDNITLSQIQITMQKTQVANVDKFIGKFFATIELGTLIGYPRPKNSTSRNEKKSKMLSGKVLVQKTYETFKTALTFKTHPNGEDVALMESLILREEPFLIYMCGGRTGEQYFRYAQKTWGLADIYNVQTTTRNNKHEKEKGVYLLGANFTINFEEHI